MTQAQDPRRSALDVIGPVYGEVLGRKALDALEEAGFVVQPPPPPEAPPPPLTARERLENAAVNFLLAACLAYGAWYAFEKKIPALWSKGPWMIGEVAVVGGLGVGAGLLAFTAAILGVASVWAGERRL